MAGAGGRYEEAPASWRRLGWVTWRQHRAALGAVAAVLGAVCLVMVAEGLTARANGLGRAPCHLAHGCAGRPPVYVPTYGSTAGTVALALEILPALVGVFVGAPLLAREFETGTFRFAWTQTCGRRRWLVAKVVPLAALVTAGAGALSLVTWWYLHPFVAANLISGIRSPEFNVRGPDFAAWTLVAFAIAVLAGAVVRRVLPAMFAALVAWAGLFFLTVGVLRPHYAAPRIGSGRAINVGWWIVGQTHAGADALYQPASRFWTFQLIETGWLVVLSVVLLWLTVRLVRRRTA